MSDEVFGEKCAAATLAEGVTLSGKRTEYGRRSGEAHYWVPKVLNALRQKDREKHFSFSAVADFSAILNLCFLWSQRLLTPFLFPF